MNDNELGNVQIKKQTYRQLKLKNNKLFSLYTVWKKALHYNENKINITKDKQRPQLKRLYVAESYIPKNKSTILEKKAVELESFRIIQKSGEKGNKERVYEVI